MPYVCVISVYVHDMKLALEFYKDKLGFAIVHESDCIVHLENEGASLILELTDKPSNVSYPGTAQIALGISTENLLKTIQELSNAGVEFVHTEPQDFPAGKYVAIKDPSGNVLEILEFSSNENEL